MCEIFIQRCHLLYNNATWKAKSKMKAYLLKQKQDVAVQTFRWCRSHIMNQLLSCFPYFCRQILKKIISN
jgi:hypothetical protein